MNTPNLSPVNNPASLEKRAYDAIKAAILAFELRPEETLVETDLARQLGISKTPVRDSLSRLENEGFIVKIPYKGYTVAPISKQTVSNIFEIRAALEGLAARLASVNFSDSDLQTAFGLIAAHSQASQQGDMPRASQVNRQFHALILARANNPRLEQILDNLDDHLQRYRVLSNYQSGRLEKSVIEHRQILAAIQDRNPIAAEQAARTHILSVAEDLNAQDFDILVNRAHEKRIPNLAE